MSSHAAPFQVTEGPLPRVSAVRRLFLGRPRARADHFEALDGLRGLAVLIVLGSHLSNAGFVPSPGIGGFGKAGVYLFFVISAFLLTHALLQRTPRQLADARLWAGYAWRRVLRIWPLYLVVLLLSASLTRAGVQAWHYQLDTAALVRHLTLQEGRSVLWSIPVEFTFYVWLPLLALALAWVRDRAWPIRVQVALAAAALAAASWLWPPAASLPNDVRLGPYLVVFLCGAFAAYLQRAFRADAAVARPRVWGLVGAVALLASALGIPAVWALVAQAPFRADVSQRWFLFYGLAWSALVLAVLNGPAWLRAMFASAPLRFVGVVSFSLYLWHMPVLDGVRAAGVAAGPLAAFAAVAASLLVAAVSFLLFERPLRDLYLPGAGRN